MAVTQYQIYAIENSAGLIKIGITQNFEKRLISLSGSNGGGHKISKTYTSPYTYLYSIEKNLHNRFHSHRIPGTEWFKGLEFADVIHTIKTIFTADSYKRCNEVRRQFEESEERPIENFTEITTEQDERESLR